MVKYHSLYLVFTILLFGSASACFGNKNPACDNDTPLVPPSRYPPRRSRSYNSPHVEGLYHEAQRQRDEKRRFEDLASKSKGDERAAFLEQASRINVGPAKDAADNRRRLENYRKGVDRQGRFLMSV